MRINPTMLNHPAVLTKIDAALRDTALKKFNVQHVLNGKGHAFLAVRYRPTVQRPGRPFRFWDCDNNDVSDLVYSTIRGGSHEQTPSRDRRSNE